MQFLEVSFSKCVIDDKQNYITLPLFRLQMNIPEAQTDSQTVISIWIKCFFNTQKPLSLVNQKVQIQVVT